MAVHFGAAVVRLDQNYLSKWTVYVGVVCASGIGISRFIKTKLEKVFGNRISIETYGKSDIDSDIKNIDANIRIYEITPDKSEDRLDFYNQLDLIHNLTAHMKMISAPSGTSIFIFDTKKSVFLIVFESRSPFPYVSIDILFPKTVSNIVWINLE